MPKKVAEMRGRRSEGWVRSEERVVCSGPGPQVSRATSVPHIPTTEFSTWNTSGLPDQPTATKWAKTPLKIGHKAAHTHLFLTPFSQVFA